MLLVPPVHVRASVSSPLVNTNVDPANTHSNTLSSPAVIVMEAVRSVPLPPVTS